MGTGILNLCIGLAFIAIGLTGSFRLRFLESYPRAPLYLGIAVAAYGAYLIVRATMRRKPPVQDE